MTKHMKTVILFALIALFGGIIVLDISRKLRILEGVDGTDSTGADAKTAPTTESAVEKCGESAPVSVLRYSAY